MAMVENGGKDDTGYYTPKNILNPAMFRLAEITRALSEVNMKIEQDKLIDDRRHTINLEQISHDDDKKEIEASTDHIEVPQETLQSKRRNFVATLQHHEDNIGKLLIISLAVSILLGSIGLLNRLDDSDSDGLSHVTNGKTSEWSVVGERFNAKWLGWDELDDSSISRLEELGEVLNLLTGDVSGVAIQNWSVSSCNLSWVVHDDDLSVEGTGLLGWVLLGVGADGSTADVLDGDVLDVESDVVSWHGFWERLVVHLDRLDFSCHVLWSEGDDHSWLDDSGLDTSDRDSSDSSDLVHVLEWEAEWSVSWALWWNDRIKSLEESLSGSVSFLALDSPSLEPWHVGGSLKHVVSVESRDWDEWDSLWIVSDLLDESRNLVGDLSETGL